MSTSTTLDGDFAVPEQKTETKSARTPAAPAAAPVAPAEPVAVAAPSATSIPQTPPEKKKLHPLIDRYKKPAMIVVGVIAFLVVCYYAFDSFTHEETDDAYVTGHLHDISTRINGVVTDVLVDDNQLVQKDQVLVKLDPADYVALSAAAKANLDVAQSNLARLQPLIATHAVAPEDVDKATSTRDVDLAQYALAQLQIQYSTITAPATGYIGRKNVEVGNRVSSGQTLMVVVEPDLWVVANFKETQLAKMQIGQPVKISIDSIPGKIFDGRVDSFSPATGNEFALLPADNSTGNFTKIVQRIPVKVTFDPKSTHGYEDRIRAGESAIVKVALTKPVSQNTANN
jgi:membrane fusion protein, multidrug efflux system